MAAPRPSFRDPSGYVEFTSTEVLRHIHPSGAEEALTFLRSPLVQQWQSSGQMIAGSIEEQPGKEILVWHPRLFFPSSLGMVARTMAGRGHADFGPLTTSCPLGCC